jgi:hypothetical protein
MTGRRRDAAVALVCVVWVAWAGACSRTPLDAGESADGASFAPGDGAASPLDAARASSDASVLDGGDVLPDGALTCAPPACTEGQSHCASGGISLCTADDAGCLVWGASEACLPGQTCASDAGAASCISIPAPRPLAPLSTATVTSQTPSLHWVLAEGDDGAQVDICRDRACRTAVATFAVTGSAGAPAAPLTAGVYFWRLHGTAGGVVGATTSPVWEFFVGARSAPVDTSWGTTLDVNGDGFADVLVGAPGGLLNLAGAAYLYLGGPSGPQIVPTEITDGTSDDGFGAAAASAGDVNGDGYGDAVIEAEGPELIGVPYVYLGGHDGLSTQATVLQLAGVGQRYASGIAAVGAGDVNGDGYGDILVGSGGIDKNSGAAYLYYGSAAGPVTTPITLPGTSKADAFGSSAASAGDVNGDGYADVLVGAVFAKAHGAAYLYLGGPTGPAMTAVLYPVGSSPTSAYFGASVAGAGDINGDGFADVAVGAPNTNSSQGAAYLYLGGSNGLQGGNVGPSVPPMTLQFGLLVGGAGDVDGDGFADLVVGSNGGATIYLGGATGLSSVPISLASPLMMGSDFGIAVGAGDVDGDGFTDVVVGEPFQESGQPAGFAYVFFGAAAGPRAVPATLTIPGGAGDAFGAAVAYRGSLLGGKR